jgi:hypothetical protein
MSLSEWIFKVVSKLAHIPAQIRLYDSFYYIESFLFNISKSNRYGENGKLCESTIPVSTSFLVRQGILHSFISMASDSSFPGHKLIFYVCIYSYFLIRVRI